MATSDSSEATLDPDDWERYRASSIAILDQLIDYLKTVRERPVWREPPVELIERAGAEPPLGPRSLDEIWRWVSDQILPHPTGNIHPRFFGWVHGTGTVGGVVAEMIAATMNSNVGGREHAAVHLERQVVCWAKRIFGFPDTASGILLSGTSMANVVGLAVARNGIDSSIQRAGLATSKLHPLVYASSEAHVSIKKALALLGLGSDSLRQVPVNDDLEIDGDALVKCVSADRATGRHPFCVIGNAGTVNTGAVDDLSRLASIAKAERLWFHVDGAFGALAQLSPRLRARLRGIEHADSLAFDFHKWLHVPYSVGCLLVRDERLHRAAFATSAGYLAGGARGLSGGVPWFCDYGPELSRGFSALKVWFVLQEHGVEKLAAMIDKNCDQARYLERLIAQHSQLELCAPVSLNIVCFRFRADGLEQTALDALNREIVNQLQESGIAAPSTSTLRGQLVIRVALTNHRTLRADLDVLVASVLRLGRDIVGRTESQARTT